jgi:glycosyltransferase involved in cell wall biosynthesis
MPLATPAISIVIPTYDRLAYLRDAVNSVLAQTVSDWELIIVDDGSTDETVAWLESLEDPRLRIVQHQHTGCPALLRNLGIELATAEWIAFLDSDDKWLPEKLERQLQYHATGSRFRWSYTAHTIIDAIGDARPAEQFKARQPYTGWIFQPLLQLDAIIALPSVVAERSLLKEVGCFDETMMFVEDYDLWLRLALHAECGIVDEPLTVVRTHRSTSFDRVEVDEAFMSVYRRIASSSISPDLQRLARSREGYYALWVANKRGQQREWRRGLAAAFVGIRRRPMRRGAYRALLLLLWRMMSTAWRSTGKSG